MCPKGPVSPSLLRSGPPGALPPAGLCFYTPRQHSCRPPQGGIAPPLRSGGTSRNIASLVPSVQPLERLRLRREVLRRSVVQIGNAFGMCPKGPVSPSLLRSGPPGHCLRQAFSFTPLDSIAVGPLKGALRPSSIGRGKTPPLRRSATSKPSHRSFLRCSRWSGSGFRREVLRRSVVQIGNAFGMCPKGPA